MELVVEEDNKRIDSYIAENTELSRVTVQRLIDEEKIRVNGKTPKSSYKVKSGDRKSRSKRDFAGSTRNTCGSIV